MRLAEEVEMVLRSAEQSWAPAQEVYSRRGQKVLPIQGPLSMVREHSR